MVQLATVSAILLLSASLQAAPAATPTPDVTGPDVTGHDSHGGKRGEATTPDTLAQRTAAQKTAAQQDVFFPVSFDDGAAVITLPAADETGLSLRAIHTTGVTSGLGSNPVGLDRGFQDSGRIIAFRRIGEKVLIEEENWRYQASADSPLEKKAVLDSFARSTLWAGKVADQNDDGTYTVDLAGFLTSDILGVVPWLKSAGQGSFSVDANRSYVDPAGILAFPDNVEFDASLTLTSDAPGAEVRATAANGRFPTLTLHHSFVRLPDAGYQRRINDPRAGTIELSYYDFSAPLEGPIVQHLARRFRLERVDPAATSGPVKEPIVFYVDSGAPKQIRDALIDGARWWADAFEAAGFEDAYRVEILPDDAHPFDIRDNIIQWTHRQTRGWSYGGGVADPRTGEMIKAHVILGSQRVRQDRMIFEGLAGTGKTGTGKKDDPVEMALARIRQLSAHEVGHTLGLAHNFAASSIDRASVMDYPAPLVRPRADNTLDFSSIYDVGMGAWDMFAIKWLYTQFPAGTDERGALNQIVAAGYDAGLRFVADGDGRSVGTAHPHGSVWDNGADPVAMLTETMAVRRIALDCFGLDRLSAGEPTSQLHNVLVPIYLYHRYQLAAAAKLVGGYEFAYAVKQASPDDDATPHGVPVTYERQRAALDAILATLAPETLDLSDATLNLLIPGNDGGGLARTSESFRGDTGPMFDLIAAASVASRLSLEALLHPARLARLVETERRGGRALTVDDVLAGIEAAIFADATGHHAAIAHAQQADFVAALIQLSSGAEAGAEARAAATGFSFGGSGVAPAAVRARIDGYLAGLRNRLQPALLDRSASPVRAHRDWLARRITSHLDRPAPLSGVILDAPAIPPGSPIGSPIGSGAATTPIGSRAPIREDCWHCE